MTTIRACGLEALEGSISGAWPLTGLRQAFLNGTLTRLIDPDHILRGKIAEFVEAGDFGLASGQKPDGTYEQIWFHEHMSTDEVMFDPGVFLIKKEKAEALKAGLSIEPEPELEAQPPPIFPHTSSPLGGEAQPIPEAYKILRLKGDLPSEVWNRLGTKIIPKLKSAGELKVGV